MSEPLETGYVEPGALRISVRTAAILLAFTLVFTALMAGTFSLTRPLLEASAQAEKLRLIGEVLPPASYDNDLLGDAVLLPENRELNTEGETRIYRARRAGAPVALVFEAAAPDGYSGRISLMLALSADGRLLAMRVTGHKETPGLGDYIDPRKDKNKKQPWIGQFEALDVAKIPPTAWRVRKDGGRFSQMNGATISARAVTNASGRAVRWMLPRSGMVFELASGATIRDADEGDKRP